MQIFHRSPTSSRSTPEGPDVGAEVSRLRTPSWIRIHSMNPSRKNRFILKNPAQIIFLGIVIFLGLLIYLFWDLPSVDSLSEHVHKPSLRITDRNGRLLYEILPEEGGRHAVLSSENIAQCMLDATIAVEDKHFYQNSGVDLEGIIRALWINFKGGETIAGGSTITQQVARNLLLQDELGQRTLRRKLREVVLAWQMTRKLSKDEILALYLNQVNYGGLSYGVEAAAQTYFGKPASDLLLPECALLAPSRIPILPKNVNSSCWD